MTSPQQTGPIDVKTGNPSTPEDARAQMLELLNGQKSTLDDNKAYYESERRPTAIGIATPPNMQQLLANVGYPRLYVNALSDRLEIEGFRLGGADEADEQLWDWWQANDLDVEATLGYTDALVHGRSYITISVADPTIDIGVDPEVPIIRVEPPTSLYAAVDPRTKRVTQALRAVFNDDGDTVGATLYTPMQTLSWTFVQGQWVPQTPANHGLGIVPVVPMPNRTRLSDLYGTSEITPELRSVTDAASRIMMNMQATAELMAVPQRLLFGVKPEELGVDPETGQTMFDAYLARILGFEDPDAKAQQFSAAELRNFTDALQEIAKQAAAYTGLPPQYLSSQSDNPASAEAIKASESRLVKNAERKAKIFGGAWEQAMRVAYLMINPGDLPPQYYRMESIWRDPSTPTYSAKADAAAKLYANGMGPIPKKRIWRDMGYSIAEMLEMEKWAEEDGTTGVLAALTKPGAPATPGAGSFNASKPTETISQQPTT